MKTSQTWLLKQLQTYVDEYVQHISSGACQTDIDTNLALRSIIADLEQIQAHPDQEAKVEAATHHISEHFVRLRMACEHPKKQHVQTPQKRTLGQSLQEYFNTEIAYLARVSGGTRRDQTNLLLGDIIADLKALALEPNDDQAVRLAVDLDQKRKQLGKLQRPWQQSLSSYDTDG